jgi:hypothetical protein
MNKTFRKSDINKYLKGTKQVEEPEEINELIDSNLSLINKNNNFKQNTNFIKSRKTTDDHVRNATQGPEAYFIYGGPYYGINYSRVVSEDEELMESKLSEEKMKSMVDEIIRKKRVSDRTIVKRTDEQDVLDYKIQIPDLSELKTVHEKPMVIRKINSLLDLIQKENMDGNELTILFNHLLSNIELDKISNENREYLSNLIKYGNEE